METGVVDALRISFRKGTVRLLDRAGEHMNIELLGLQGAHDGARGRDHLAVLVGRQEPDELAEPIGDRCERCHLLALQQRSLWEQSRHRQSVGSLYARGSSSPATVALITATAR